MGKPRKQIYTLEMYLKKLKDQDIRQDQDVQRLSDQWNNAMMNELIFTVLNGEYMPPIILGEEKNSQMWVIDGLQRSTALRIFRYGNYRITSSIEEPIISYRAKVKDADGVKIDGNGDIVWEDKEFDLKNKTFDRLPEELQKKFNEYQIETVIHEGYSMKDISKLVRRYNNHKAMNASQKAFTFVDNYARKIREILKRTFFIECTGYTKNERKNGTLERIIMESVMCMFHLDNWKKAGQIGSYINENASVEDFDQLDADLHRLEQIITEQHYSFFTSKDSFLWFTMFHKFTQLGCQDEKFADFLTYFRKETDGMNMEEFYGMKRDNSSNKDKSVIIKKLDKIEAMMYEFLGIEKVEPTINVTSEMLEFVRENVNSDSTPEDIIQYKEVLDALASKLDSNIKLMEADNNLSMVAIVAWSFKQDIDLDNWIVDYCNRNDTYISNQSENFKHMCEDLEEFIKSANVA